MVHVIAAICNLKLQWQSQIQFSSVQFSPLIDWVIVGHEGQFSRNQRVSAELTLQSSLWEAIVRGLGMGRDVQSLTLFFQNLLSRGITS